MAMTLPIIIPSTPSSGNSPASDASNTPRTPISPNMQSLTLPGSNSQPANAASAQMKRKPSRRANTAERRATHNAVERQRRETLNGRFLVSQSDSNLPLRTNLPPGPRRSPPKFVADPPSFKILHCKLFYRSHPRFQAPSPPRSP